MNLHLTLYGIFCIFIRVKQHIFSLPQTSFLSTGVERKINSSSHRGPEVAVGVKKGCAGCQGPKLAGMHSHAHCG